jgi:hypothetical protein
MNRNRPCLAVIGLLLTTLVASAAPAQGHGPNRAQGVHRIYVEALGTDPEAVYLRRKLLSKLAKSHKLMVVDDPTIADLVLRGTAQMRPTGYYNSNPRVRYRNSASVPVYDAKMSVVIANGQGRCLWSGTIKSRFWGSQYVSDNVVNQAARHVVDVLRQRENERHSPPDC